MAANRIESAKNGANGADAAAAPAAAAPKAAGGIKPWIPLIANLVLMPVLAYATTTFVLIPKLRGGAASAPAHGEAETKHETKKESSSSSSHGENTKEVGKGKVIAPLSAKVLVNLAGTLGTRYLLANITLVGSNGDFKALVEKNDVQLRDVAASILSSKTIPDLEKPGSRNLIRTELITVFNNVLGNGAVNDIYLTDFAVQ